MSAWMRHCNGVAAQPCLKALVKHNEEHHAAAAHTASLPPSIAIPRSPSSWSLNSVLQSPHVHFPPTPRLVTSTHAAYSSSTYDRAPIRVTSNDCALPERGDREYEDVVSPPTPVLDGYFSMAEETIAEEVPDLTWTSDEPTSSDDYYSDCSPPLQPAAAQGIDTTVLLASRPKPEHEALAFLPHPPAGPPLKQELSQPIPKSPKRPRMCKRRATPRRLSPLTSGLTTSDESEEDDCLGGF